jgi:hypothetical protein
MKCEYKGCENPADKTVWTEESGPDDPLCVVCPFHAEMIKRAPIQQLAVAVRAERMVWLMEPSYPGESSSVQ